MWSSCQRWGGWGLLLLYRLQREGRRQKKGPHIERRAFSSLLFCRGDAKKFKRLELEHVKGVLSCYLSSICWFTTLHPFSVTHPIKHLWSLPCITPHPHNNIHEKIRAPPPMGTTLVHYLVWDHFEVLHKWSEPFNLFKFFLKDSRKKPIQSDISKCLIHTLFFLV